MSAANKKFRQLDSKVHGWKAKDYQEDKNLLIKDTFPHCRATFDTCPSEEDLKSALEKKMAPSVCGKCPIFQKNPPRDITVQRERLMSPEDEEYYKKVMGK